MANHMKEQTELTLARIVELADYQRMIRHPGNPAQGQFVVTGPNFKDDSARVGYCVQVRKHVGQFGSDMVFLRHVNGSLTVHENNCYIVMNAEQEALARSVFDVLPEDEEYDKGYRDCEKVHEVGFVVENSASHGTPDIPFAITIMTTKGGAA
ncbi:plasmid protein [Salmonella enterica subsp. enterica]|nr:plasmid protein [Salmonella enterica]ECC3312170.1 plasmid protein [Salmonella enterica subsp. enterica]EDR2819041.1 plasmid protein [Salmonella enterica subsp. enterica]EEJ9202754.1 plasmid protein [Salmonella enterica subsp. enterica serovar Newport]EJV0313836.1 plasmid protein [Salmonella enterica]